MQKSFPHIKGQPWYIHADQTFYSSFEGNCREIVNYSLPSRRNPPQKNLIPREKCPQKIAPGKSPLPENNLEGIQLPFRKFRLYFRPNMIGWTIRPHIRRIAYCWMQLVQASKDISQTGQAYKIGILEKIVNSLKFILRHTWWTLRVYLTGHLDQWYEWSNWSQH